MTNMLFCDLGTRTGVAYGRPGAVVVGELDLSRSRFDSWCMTPVALKRGIKEIYSSAPFEHAGYEQVRRHMSTDAAHLYGALVSAFQEIMLELGVTYESVGVGTLKKFWTGSGSARKEAMVDEARRRGHMVASDNEADALAGWYWLQAQACPAYGQSFHAQKEAAE